MRFPRVEESCLDRLGSCCGSEFWNLQNVLLLMGRRLLSGWLLSLRCQHRLSEQRAQLPGQGGRAYLSRLPAADSDLKFMPVTGGGPGRPVGKEFPGLTVCCGCCSSASTSSHKLGQV